MFPPSMRIASTTAALMLATGFLVGSGSLANASTLYWKNGSHVTREYAFSGSNSGNMPCYATADISDAVVCLRKDRNATYVKSTKASGLFKLGQHKSSGNVWRCQNNYQTSSGDGTWVECRWGGSHPAGGQCGELRTGHGDYEWYVLSRTSRTLCW